MNSRRPEPNLPSQAIKNQGLDELIQVGFVPTAAVSTAKILIPNSH
ncbi:hypothetical protein H6G89_11725 [Oscillatoria sp. FACHB-1407]|nr:hypothetical protein [Oscillatoria sp. FACHB-1407]MBD2461721.1 hypothetical protein [Oscillatoria sp. FACHB-1407]